MARLENVRFPVADELPQGYDVALEAGFVRDVRPSSRPALDGSLKLILPPLCHPHVHLDKPYILTCNHAPSPSHPDYSDLTPQSGSFDEALSNTSKAKERYTQEDLYLRGSQLLATSYQQGVTSLRAFVEIDHVTGTRSLETSICLKNDFAHLIDMQICAFAQDPIFSTAHGDDNRSIITAALHHHAASIDALGTTPYVEKSRDASLQNIEWAITTAIAHGLHLDFHLDYNLGPAPSISSNPLTFSVIELLRKHRWVGAADRSKTIILGHCTQLTMLEDAELKHLAESIIASKLPIHFVGLPTSDMYMMGRPGNDSQASHNRPRGTLQVPKLIKDLGLSACIGINNVGNAFTPYGTGDPLHLASWAVGLYHAGTARDALLLYGCVSWRARFALGMELGPSKGAIKEGQDLRGMLLIDNRENINLPGASAGTSLKVHARPRVGIKDIVWDPPEVNLRSIIR
ncbi:amidohydrolase [Xylariaceae sp. FL0016]|nr:amidohydrolase [Xylariaceae sp. FL0016]